MGVGSPRLPSAAISAVGGGGVTPFIEVLTGTCLIISGLVFEGQRSRFDASAMSNEKTANEQRREADISTKAGLYLWGMADNESSRSGQTSRYWDYKSRSNVAISEGLRQGGIADALTAESRDDARTASLYQGMSITSIVFGCAYFVKGLVGYARREDKKSGWVITPTKRAHGLAIGKRWG